MPQRDPQLIANYFPMSLVLAAAVLVFAVSVTLRATTKSTWELQLSDAVIALIPVIVWLAVTGKLTELQIGANGFSAKFEAAIAAPIGSAVQKLPVQPLVADEKLALSALPQFIARKDQGLIFRLGKPYVSEIAEQYLDELTRYSFFRFVEIEQNGGAFFGLIDAHALSSYLKSQSTWPAFIKAISSVDENYLRSLPSFTDAASAVSETTEKSQVLEKMEQEHLDWLPVLGSNAKLVGVVDRSAILARLVLDLNQQLRK